MNQQSIVLNGISYTHDQIIKGKVNLNSDFETSTIVFCKAWLTGKEAFQLTTSGSTGIPKEITFTRGQMIASAQMTQKALGLSAHGTSLVCLDTQYIAGQMMLVRSFVVGMNIYAVEPSANPLTLIDEHQNIDFAAFVPYQLHAILNANSDKLNKIKVAIIGGAAIDPILNKKLDDIKCDLYATYGMTETISHVALMKLNGSNPSHYFHALPEVSLKLDNRGCLVINTKFLDDEIVTNDLVELKDSHQFKWLGRWDNIINTGGVKVIPEKVENELGNIFDELGLQNRFFIAGFVDQTYGQKICLLIEGDELSESQLEDLWSKMKTALPKYEAPKEILFINKFQETTTGKISRAETINLFPVKFQ